MENNNSTRTFQNVLIWLTLLAIVLLGTKFIIDYTEDSYSSIPDNVPEENTTHRPYFEQYLDENQEYIIMMIEDYKQGKLKPTTSNKVMYIQENPSKIDIEVRYDHVLITDKYGTRARVPFQ